MSSTALKALSVAVLVLAILLALFAFAVSKRWVDRAQQTEMRVRAEQAKQLQQPLVVVALEPLLAGQPVPAASVALKPVSVLPPQPITNLDSVVDRVPSQEVLTGTPLSESHFAVSQRALSPNLLPGFQALSVEINEVIAVGGFLQPGDRVDVLAFIRGEAAQAQRLLADILVLAVEDRLVSGTSDSRDDGRRRLRTAVLAVPADMATKVLLAVNSGELRLTLRPAATVPVPTSVDRVLLTELAPPPPPPKSEAKPRPVPVASTQSKPKVVRPSVDVFLGAKQVQP